MGIDALVDVVLGDAKGHVVVDIDINDIHVARGADGVASFSDCATVLPGFEVNGWCVVAASDRDLDRCYFTAGIR